MDEIERKRALNALQILTDAVEDPTTKNAMRALLHMFIDLDKRLDNLVTMLEEDDE
jgi:hypothetical protein